MATKENLSQAELFGVNDLPEVKKDEKTGIGTNKNINPELVFTINPDLRKQYADVINKQLDLMFKDVRDAMDNGTKIGASPLPWHWAEGGGGVINVFDANGAMVFDNINSSVLDVDRDWVNVELMVACVNKFASMITPDELDRLRKKQVYGDENKIEE